MKKALLFVLLVIVFAGCIRKKKEEQQPKIVVNDLPAMLITTLNGEQVYTKNLSGKTVLILFQPDCDHCQREAKQMHDNLEAFREYQMYFISIASIDQLEKFSIDYQFSNEPSVHFATTALDQIISGFGSIDAPSVFVYSAEGKLIRHFNGEVDISKILEVL